MTPRFIQVRKDNKTKDRGFIAVDAICSVFENKENHNVSIMTMDGFWYDVADDIEQLYELVMGDSDKKKEEPQPNAKKEYLRRKRMMPANSDNDGPKMNHEEVHRSSDIDIFKRSMHIVKGKQPDVSKIKKRNLPAGAGEGRHDLNPVVDTPLEKRIPGEGL